MTQTGTGATFTISATTNTIIRSTGNYVTDGFTIGQTISIIGSNLNRSKYTIKEIKQTTIANDTIVTNESLANETIATSYALVFSSETVLFNNQYITSRIQNADSNALKNMD